MLWQDIFMCKIPHIDAQHRALFQQISDLAKMQGDIARIPATLEFLATYTTEHFSDEESLHSQTRYPQAMEHKRQHDGLIAQISEVRRDYERAGHGLLNLMTIQKVLVDWLTAHILNSDKQFATFFHALPDDLKRTLRLPPRPWIPESSQSFYERVTGIHVKGDTARTGKDTGRQERISSSWTNSLLCGIPEIDDQHKELFRQIDMLRDQSNKDRIPMVLRFLTDYVVKHFNDEEGIHRRSNYPKAAEHKKLHENFVKTFYESKEKFDKSNGDFKSLMEVNKLVYDWLRDHVMKVDKEFARYYLPLQEASGQTSDVGVSSGGTRTGVETRRIAGDTETRVTRDTGTRIARDTGTRITRDTGTRIARDTATRVSRDTGTRVSRDTGTRVSQTGSWTDSLLCGIPSIDEQHKELFRQVDILRDRSNEDRVPAVLNFLADYVVKHFTDEEHLHRQSRYPQAAGHKKLHEDFVKTFLDAKQRLDNSDHDFKAVLEVNTIVYNWLREHVMKVDKAFGRYYIARQEGRG